MPHTNVNEFDLNISLFAKKSIEIRNKYKRKKDIENYLVWRNKVVSMIRLEKAN